MNPVSFLQSEEADPYALYHAMRRHAPVYYDRTQNLWGVYTYAHCDAVLHHPAAVVPQGPQFFASLSYEADQIGRHLARVSNGSAHDVRRHAAHALLTRWQSPDVGRLLLSLLDHSSDGVEVDWVEQVGMVLPSLALLEGLGFSRDTAMMITRALPDLVRMMLPVKTPDDAQTINQAVVQVLPPICAYIRQHAIVQEHEAEMLYVSNLLGLLIQSHEAGRGLLCHALLQTFRQPVVTRPYDAWMSFVRETLRFDPPIHHTRRVLVADVVLEDVTIPAGATVLVMLASANRDAQYFVAPDVFDPGRERAIPYLSFGAGVHRCMAEHFSIDLAAAALRTLYSRYARIYLLEQDIQYMAKANARLPVRMLMALGR